jgi:hypothetical protein
MARARSRAEQERIVAGWRTSGKSARAYAAAVGVSVSSVHRWAGATATESDRPRLVEVVAGDGGGEASRDAWCWELELDDARLRATTPLDASVATAIVTALARRR